MLNHQIGVYLSYLQDISTLRRMWAESHILHVFVKLYRSCDGIKVFAGYGERIIIDLGEKSP